jgi:hypothetical protein
MFGVEGEGAAPLLFRAILISCSWHQRIRLPEVQRGRSLVLAKISWKFVAETDARFSGWHIEGGTLTSKTGTLNTKKGISPDFSTK